jgi:predicted esterase
MHRTMRAWIVVAGMLWSATSIAAETPKVVETSLGGVPAVLRIPATVSRPPVVLWHGFGPPESERALMDAIPLDEVPAIKVYLGLPLFGKRAPSGGIEEFIRRQKEDMPSLIFEPVVMGAARELPAVIRDLIAQKHMRAGEKISLFGFSAGGASVLYALALREAPISTAVTVNASTGLSASVAAYEHATKQPFVWSSHARNLAKMSDAAGRAIDIAAPNPPPALLIVHGSDDTMLTPKIASTLYDSLLPRYRQTGNEARLRLEIVPGMAHTWATSDRIEALRGMIAAWFNR